jgi:hypothetical protein
VLRKVFLTAAAPALLKRNDKPAILFSLHRKQIKNHFFYFFTGINRTQNFSEAWLCQQFSEENIFLYLIFLLNL